MALSPIEWISGITATLILVVGYTCGLLLILKYSRKAPNKDAKLQIILTGIVFISLFGIIFSGVLSIKELFFTKCIDCNYSLLLPSCVYGLIFYIIIFIISLKLLNKK